MKKKQSVFIAILMLAIMLISLYGCNVADTSPSAASDMTTQQLPSADPADLYNQAADEIRLASDLSVSIVHKVMLTRNGQSFTSDSTQTLSYTGRGSDQMLAQCHEKLTVGDHSIEITDHYGSSNGYTSFDGIGFSSEMSQEDFLARYLSAVLLDADLYGAIDVEAVDGKTMLIFSAATAPESWACAPVYQINHASGAVTLDSNGHLEGCTYTFYGEHEDVAIEVIANVTVNTSSITPIDLPGNQADYTPISYLDGPKLLEKATGYLLQGNSVTAINTQEIQSQAFMLSRTLTTQLDMYQDGNSHNSRRSTTVISSNIGPEETAQQYQQEEVYKGGKYVLIADGQAPKNDRTVTAESMHTYCQDLLVSTILMPQYITDSKYTEDNGQVRIHYTANEALGNILAEQASDSLYDDPGLLNHLASKYETTSLEAYLIIDSVTGLPIASGISYSGMHTIEDFAYSLVSKQDQTYTLGSETAKDTIDALSFDAVDPSQPTATTGTEETPSETAPNT